MADMYGTNNVYISDLILSWLLITKIQNQTNTLLHWVVRSSYLGLITLKFFGRDQHGQTARNIPNKWFTMAERFLQYSLCNLMNKNSRLLGTRIKKHLPVEWSNICSISKPLSCSLGNHFWWNESWKSISGKSNFSKDPFMNGWCLTGWWNHSYTFDDPTGPKWAQLVKLRYFNVHL